MANLPQRLLLLLIVPPLVELYFLIKVGGNIGVGSTVFLVLFTAVLGAVLVRAQGFSVLARVRAQVAQGLSPALELLEGLVLFIAGALLLVPGFISDGLGFLLLIPALRIRLIKIVVKRGIDPRIYAKRADPDGAKNPRIIDGEFTKVDRDQ